ncbi:hypothetical protein JHK85_048657 [Glycine max]|nr:hypothetical protein JHK85_048657 [Glycine max]
MATKYNTFLVKVLIIVLCIILSTYTPSFTVTSITVSKFNVNTHVELAVKLSNWNMRLRLSYPMKYATLTPRNSDNLILEPTNTSHYLDILSLAAHPLVYITTASSLDSFIRVFIVDSNATIATLEASPSKVWQMHFDPKNNLSDVPLNPEEINNVLREHSAHEILMMNNIEGLYEIPKNVVVTEEYVKTRISPEELISGICKTTLKV